ncbi:MAG: hypothetical protein H6807_17485 [Planctomycetes bacterium]|nr:hypothetical protein [Planctomycetota bacterium]
MTRISTLLALLLVAGLAACGGDSPDSVKKDTVATMNELTDVLKEIKAKGDVAKHEDEITDLIQQLQDLRKRGEELEKEMSADDKIKMAAEMGKEIGEAFQVYRKEIMRIGTNPELRSEFESVSKKLEAMAK